MKPKEAALITLKAAESFGYVISSQNKDLESIAKSDDSLIWTSNLLSAQESVNKIRKDIAEYQTFHSSTGRPSVIDNKVMQLNEELLRIKQVIEHQVQIQACLQSEGIDPSLPIHVKYHKPIIDLITMMPKMMVELKSNLESLEWYLRFQPSKIVEELCAKVTLIYSRLQNTARNLEEFRLVTSNLHSLRSTRKN